MFVISILVNRCNVEWSNAKANKTNSELYTTM